VKLRGRGRVRVRGRGRGRGRLRRRGRGRVGSRRSCTSGSVTSISAISWLSRW